MPAAVRRRCPCAPQPAGLTILGIMIVGLVAVVVIMILLLKLVL